MKKDKKWFIDKWTKERDKTSIHEPMYYFINDFITDVKELDEAEVLSQEWVDDNTFVVTDSDGDDYAVVENRKLKDKLVPKWELREVLSQDWIDENKVARIDNLKKMTMSDVVPVDELQYLLVPKQEITYEDALKVIAEHIDTDEFSIGLYIEALNNNKKYEFLTEQWIEGNKFEVNGWNEAVHVEDLENLIIPKKELPVIPKYVADWLETHLEQGFDLYPALKKIEDNSRLWTKGYNWYRENTLDFTIAYLTGEYEVEEEPLYFALIKGHELVNDEGEWSTKYWNLWVSGGSVFPADRLAGYDDFLTTMSKEEWSEWGINDTNADFVKVEEIEE